ncbi:MAG: hypothetical protein V4631_22180 [Pseudomonadota bacterium]
MDFATIAITVIALALLVFIFARRRVITGLQQHNNELAHQVQQLSDIAHRQRDEITQLINTAEKERRARQMATLAAAGNQTPAPRPPTAKPKEWKDPGLARDPYQNAKTARKQEEATRHDPAPATTWDNPGSVYTPSSAPSPATTMAEATYQGRGGTFDGGGASGDYGRSDSGACSSSSSSSDSGSSSSSDSGSSCGSY